MSEWQPEIEVDELLARTLIAQQFPGLDSGTLERIGEGWDYTIWATADRVAFRFPRRGSVVPGMCREMGALPALSAQLPAAIPDAGYPGAPSPDFAWPFFGSNLIAGTELTEAGLSDRERAGLAHDLGTFLGVLHKLPAPLELLNVVDPNRRADMSFRIPRTREMIGRISTHWPAARDAKRILSAAEQLEPESERVLVHGDLHLRQILVTDTGRLSGVVDWVDICVAPAAVDLAPFWSLFSPEGRNSFLAAYGPVDPNELLRARVLALCLSAMLAAYAIDRGEDALLKETLAELDRTLVD